MMNRLHGLGLTRACQGNRPSHYGHSKLHTTQLQVITFIINGLIFFYVGASAVNFTIRWAGEAGC